MVRAARREYDPPRIEAEIRALWEKEGTYREARRRRAGGPKWYFIDGPPYATGHIHLGTAWNKTLKDAVVRYKSMRGFRVRDQAGFDMHGLPIEVKVEKDIGIRSKKEIEERGVADFVARCRKFALDHVAIMTGEFQELGVWLDWERPYLTIANEYMEGAWWALAKAHERSLLYEAERVLTWCWRCETALAAAEIEYEDRKDPSVFVRFPLVGKPDESLVIWTTTPWTLPANVAVAANPDLEYARVKVVREGKTEVLVLLADQAENVARLGRFQSFEVLERMRGAHLEGWRYAHPFRDEVPRHREPRGKEQTILLGAHVAGDRTGLVHTATGHGAEDFDVGVKYQIPPFSPVGEDGRYTKEAGSLAGLRVKGAESDAEDADKRVLALLREKGLLVHAKDETHSYGHCWRCKNPIIYRATRQWFVEIARIKERMLAETERVRWTPEWAGSARQADWVRQARDWCISRQRYWGIPLPVWKCLDGCVRVVGSRADLDAAA
ncbi:MAG TPA: class I tRNA ligase family protein, partial [Candidatus Thermoplasmatota archaeon]|nr:class I tRNA ligase family protein [Candidatus Thermoplasmatota archaeon]